MNPRLVHLDILHTIIILLDIMSCLCHVENRWGFAWIIDDVIVDVIIIDDVGDVASA